MQPNEVVTDDVLDSPHDEEEDVDASVILKKLRLSNKNSLLIAHLNINSIRNKLEALKFLISKNIDILIIAETKIDETLPTNQFLIDGYMPPLRADRNRHGGDLLIYVKESLPAKEVSTSSLTSKEIEIKVIEINLHEIK